MPCPISTFPGEIITCPSDENLTHDDRTGFAARLTGNFGAEEGTGLVIGLASRPPRAAPPAPCDYANRNGKDYGRAPPSPLRRWDRGFASIARRRSSRCRKRNSRTATPARR